MKEDIITYLEKNHDRFSSISNEIWDYAELAFQEEKTSQIQAAYLEQRGFHITYHPGEVPNAIIAEWGTGSPVIAICGELDALPNMSQTADLPEQKPIKENGAGHGCGHHLLGTASMAAADALRELMDAENLTGTIRYYGCPAEEYGSGKAYLVREGLFDDVDIALCWHPYQYNCLLNTGWIASLMVRYVFHGVSANPAHSAHLGRSALDAAELMGVGTQYLREHVKPDVRIHYAYQDSGGVAANVIPIKVSLNYTVRAQCISDALEVKERIDQIAQGAALMTGTTVDGHLHNGMSNLVSNPIVDQVLNKNLHEAPVPQYSEEELAYAETFKSVTQPENLEAYAQTISEHLNVCGEELNKLLESPICNTVLPNCAPMYASTDFGDVSQTVPASQIGTACYSIGTPTHSWQACATGKSEIAHKGARYAAEVLAMTGYDFLTKPELIKAAKDSFLATHGSEKYHCVIPPEVKPHGYEY